MLDRSAKVLIAGHAWFLWSSVTRKFKDSWFRNLLLVDRAELDLSDARAVSAFFDTERPEAVVLCAAKVGWVAAHASGQYSMLHDNLVIQNSVIDAAYRHGVSRLLFVSSGTVYPSECEQPIPESAMFGGPFDPLHESYALAKIAWMKLCEKVRSESWRDFFSLVPTNMYWEGDTFDDGRSNVVCSLMKRFYDARESGKSEVVVWGSGKALRDFLYVDDMAGAILHFLENPPSASFLNIGSDQEVSISHLAESIGGLLGYEWSIVFDSLKPEGRLRRKLDSSLANSLGWNPSVPLSDWLAKTLDFYMSTINR